MTAFTSNQENRPPENSYINSKSSRKKTDARVQDAFSIVQCPTFMNLIVLYMYNVQYVQSV